jgi:hypothetical protein
MPDMRRRSEDIVRYYGELSRRVASSGIDGIPQLLEVEKQLEMAMGEVASQELNWAADELRRLLDELVQMNAKLESLRELKMMMNGVAGDGVSTRRSLF